MTDQGTTPRQDVAAQILADHPKWIVWDYPDVPKQVAKGRPVVSVWRSDLAPNPTTRAALDHEISLNLYGAKVIGAGAETELDDLLDGVMLSLERVAGFKFARATRSQFANDTIAGWTITGSVTSANVYRSTIIQERAS